jgi:hypothetical protein
MGSPFTGCSSADCTSSDKPVHLRFDLLSLLQQTGRIDI